MTDFQWASGLLLGLSAGIAPGPLLTLVISQTLRYGQREGIKVAVAPLVTDLPIITAALIFGAWIADMPRPLGVLSLAGAVYICFLSWESVTLAPSGHTASPQTPKSLRKGVTANLLNPHPYLFWLTVGTPLILSAWKASVWIAGLWLSGFYLMLVGAKVFLAIVAGQARQWLHGSGYVWLNRLLGAVLFLFAIRLGMDGVRLMGFRP